LAISELTEAFDRVNDILQKQRYIAGDQLTEADVRLFVTLLRYDEVYYVYFKTNTRSVANSPAILNYCRDIYQTPGVTETVDMEQIKAHYYCSHTELNTYSIIPRGPGFMNLLAEPHNREGM
jgi:putative glutathione S-transferase